MRLARDLSGCEAELDVLREENLQQARRADRRNRGRPRVKFYD
jgi:hypothetical protein